MNLEFVNDLNESSQYRTRFSLKSKNAREIADHCFMDLISLWILYNEYEYAPMAIEYARKTSIYGNFNLYRQSGTDLYITSHIMTTENADLIENSEADKVFFEKLNVNGLRLFQFIKKISKNDLRVSFARQFLQEIERTLYIDNGNYRSIRRMSQNWGYLSEKQKSLVISKILQFYRSNASRSELYNIMLDLSKEKGYITTNTSDVEKTDGREISTGSRLTLLSGSGDKSESGFS